MSRASTGVTLDERNANVQKGWRTGAEQESNTSGATTSTGNRRGPVSATRTIKEIEAAADFYDPGIYLEGLTFGPDLTAESDPLGEQYIPLSATRKNPKIFAVGILPPQAPITGRILDRSASIRSVLEAPVGVPGANFNVTEITREDGSGREHRSAGSSSAASQLPKQFWVDYVSMCERLGVNPFSLAAVFYNESRFDPHAVHPSGIAKGLGQFIRTTAQSKYVNMSDDVWKDFENLSAREQLPYWEDYLKGIRVKHNPGIDEKRVATWIYEKHFGGGYSGNAAFGYAGSRYVSWEAQQAAFERLRAEKNRLASVVLGGGPAAVTALERIRQIDALLEAGFESGGPDGFQNRAYHTNAPLDGKSGTVDGVIGRDDMSAVVANLPTHEVRALIQEALDSGMRSGGVSRQEDGGLQEGEEETTPQWENQGSESAEEAARRRERMADTGYNSTTIGDQFTAAQKCEIAAARGAVEAMRDLPPLRMLLNPSSFAVKGEKIVSDGNWSRNGPIVEFWGDNQDKISASGQVAGFYAMDYANATGPGLTRNARSFSESYRNFLGLYQIYRNNGGVYLAPCGATDRERNLSLLGSVYLYYDNTLYFGSFDSITLSEEDGKPFTLSYSWEFTVRAAFLLDRPQDPGISYGAQAQKFMTPEKATLPYREPLEPVITPISDMYDQQAVNEATLLQARRDLVGNVGIPDTPVPSLQERLATFQRQQARYNAGAISFSELQAWQERLELTNEEIYQ